MGDVELGRVFRALRHRAGWRQSDLSERGRQPRNAVVDLEAGRIGRLRVDTVRDLGAALGARVTLGVDWHGAELSRLLDAGHAALAERWMRRLEALGWLVRAEVSFNHFGERGRYDLLAWHPTSTTLLVVEIKTVVPDLQSLFGVLDTKARLAPLVAPGLGWRAAGSPTVVSLLVMAESSTNRRRVAEHAALFRRFTPRGRAALRWLAAPETGVEALLLLSKLPDVRGGDHRRAGRQRVRRSQRGSRSKDARAGR